MLKKDDDKKAKNDDKTHQEEIEQAATVALTHKEGSLQHFINANKISFTDASPTLATFVARHALPRRSVTRPEIEEADKKRRSKRMQWCTQQSIAPLDLSRSRGTISISSSSDEENATYLHVPGPSASRTNDTPV